MKQLSAGRPAGFVSDFATVTSQHRVQLKRAPDVASWPWMRGGVQEQSFVVTIIIVTTTTSCAYWWYQHLQLLLAPSPVSYLDANV